MDEAKPIEEPTPATSPLGRASPDPAEYASNSDCDAATSEPILTCGWSDEQLALIWQATSQQGQSVNEETGPEQMFATTRTLEERLFEFVTGTPFRSHSSATDNQIGEGTEDTGSITRSQYETDIKELEQQLRGQLDEPESQQPPRDSNCPECHIKKEWTRELEMRLMDQENIARQYEENPRKYEERFRQQGEVHQRNLADLSCRINELEAQKSGQASTLEDSASQPLPPHYYCSDCSWTQRKLYDAKQKSRDLEREVERRKKRAYALVYEVDKARDEREVLRQRLDEANIEIARLRAQFGPRTSKL